MIYRTCKIIRHYNSFIETVLIAKRTPRAPSQINYFLSQRHLSDLSLPPSASLVQNDSRGTVVLLGTVHFSKQSVEDVTTIVKSLNPNAILVELCRQRVSLLELDDKKFLEDAQKFDARKMKQAVKGQNIVSGMLHAMLLKTYADIAKELGVAPGGEFRRAYQEMKKIPGCKLFLGDRPIQITIARAFQSLSVYELGQVLYHLTTSNPKPLDKNSLERYKDRDFVQAQFEEITRDVPAFKKIFHVFVDERDKCLAYSLQECVRTVNNPRVLAVVGMGHVDGIIKYYGRMKQEDIVPLLLDDSPCSEELVHDDEYAEVNAWPYAYANRCAPMRSWCGAYVSILPTLKPGKPAQLDFQTPLFETIYSILAERFVEITRCIDLQNKYCSSSTILYCPNKKRY
ncbi:traB domain-containing protein-like isoform X2 [Plodia interpunctella]|uniref:traB domain-containing protein-like isoform X2 n=1 Tax=Plodia interpunctella TaxID=58824 RepID=UPI0023683AE3|nr:traB domain-containing protein-like isoform X2 [Plodia interpunctella]